LSQWTDLDQIKLRGCRIEKKIVVDTTGASRVSCRTKNQLGNMQAAAGSKDAQGTRDFLTSPLHKLGPDIIRNLQLHLKPRHVLKLMLRCKNMFQILDSNDQYWARVAAHAVWRDLYELEITPEAAEIQRNIILKDEHICIT
jgi:hypothetical protein